MELKALDRLPASCCRLLIQKNLLMKVFTILLVAAGLHAHSAGFSQKITFSGRNVPFKKFMAAVESQTNYSFFAAHELIENLRITVEAIDEPVNEVLDRCLKGHSLSYKIVDKTIFIKEWPGSSARKNIVDPPAVIDIRGRVLNDKNDPLPGASVEIKGSRKGTYTDAGGQFELRQVEVDAVLLISYSGYSMQEVEVSGRNFFQVSLSLKGNTLDETVIKGYYTTTQRLNTGNVSTVKSEDIQKQPVSDAVMALEGRVPGLYIAQSSGVPGSNFIIRLRGQNSIANGNDPLYIVDGVPVSSTSLTNPFVGSGALGNPAVGPGQGMSPFNNLNPSDIESISVLKDADATAIYGSRGANGVVLITTKKGKAANTRFEINLYSGAGKVVSKMQLLNTGQYLAMRHEALNNDGLTAGPGDYDINGAWDTTHYTDWQKELVGHSANFTNAQASLSGGNANTQFLISGNYSSQGTVFPGNFSDRKVSMHVNMNHASSNQHFRAFFSASYVNDNSNLPGSDLARYILLAPDVAPYDKNGNINWQYDHNGNYTFINPLGLYLKPVSKALTDNLITNINLSYDILPGLQVKASAGYTHSLMNQTNQTPSAAYPAPYDQVGSLRSNTFGNMEIKTWIIEPQLDYMKRFGMGKLEILAGSTFQQNVQNSLAQNASGYSSDALIPSIAAASSIVVFGSGYTQYRYNALFCRVNYNWDEKFLLNLTARRDGSSRFGPGRQFGNFGAAGAGWIFSKKPFIQKSMPALSFGKLRVSYGSTGNDQLSDYQFLSTYSVVPIPYQGITGLSPTRIPNPDFGWELVKKIEGGLDLGFMKDRILLNVSYYRNRTNNQLVGWALPSIAGFSTVQANLPAIVQNTGLEMGLNTVNIKSRHFGWTSSFNISMPRNKLVAYPNLASSAYSQTYAIGKPLFIFYNAHYTGVDPQKGVYQFQNVAHAGNTTTPSYPDDYQFLKSATQNYFGGFLNSFTYKGWQMEIFLQFVKQTGFNYFNLFNSFPPGSVNQNLPSFFLDRWQKPGDNTGIQEFSTTANPGVGDGVISDASFVRLKNLSLSYTLPSGWQKRARLQNARIYMQCQNLVTFTHYKGLDPETQSLSLPPLRMLTAGIQLAF